MNSRKLITGLLILGFSSLSAAELPCEQHYVAGLDMMSKGDHLGASAEFYAAVELDPKPRLGDSEYLPHIHLAVANFKAGRNRSARDALVISQVHGIAAQSAIGQALLEEYASSIMSAPLYVEEPALPEAVGQHLALLTTGGRSLSALEVEEIRTRVLRRCAVSPDLSDNKLPWYFHYEFGNDLMMAGDSGRAVQSFRMSANLLEAPKRGKRMYGMWYVDYIPYFRIALAHAKLGEWEDAQAALLTSQSFNEISPEDPDFDQYHWLQGKVAEMTELQDGP